jgi:phage host-nuclease inhibitor protein Gam
MAKRVKPQTAVLIPVATWEEADDLVRQIGDRRMAVAEAQAASKAKIDDLKETLAEATAAAAADIDLRVRSLEAYCAHHPEGFDGKRSRSLAFGTVGWRKSTRIKVKKTTLEKILTFFGPKRGQPYIRTKQEPDKEALAKLDDVQLKQVDAVREVTDEFFVEPDIPAAVDYGG